MGAFIAKQPNGLYCRFSSVVDCPTHINMTFDDYVNYIRKKQGLLKRFAIIEAKDVIQHYLHSFDEVIDSFIDNNMTKAKFAECVNKMKMPAETVKMEST